MNIEEQIWRFLKAQGMTDAGAAGLMGNLYAESGLRPNNLQNTYEGRLGYRDAEYTEMVDKGTYTAFATDKAGYGLCQWTYHTRKAALLAYAKAEGTSIGDLEMQLGFLMRELESGYKAVLAALKSTSSVREASDTVLLQFERPANQGAAVKEKRAGYGQTYYDKYAGKGAQKVNLIQSIMTKNPCYTGGRKITVKGLMLHSVGCAQPNAKVFVNNWNKPSFGSACVHAFIDGNTGDVYQCLPWNHRGWHCASGKKGSGNNTRIGVEMCEPGCIKYTGGATFTCSDPAAARAVAARTYQSAVELFAMLCKQYGLDPLADGVVISHKEGCARGIASNHGDPEHLWTQLGTGYTMDGFRKAVKAAMGGTATTPAPAPSTPSKPAQTTEKNATEAARSKDKTLSGTYTVTAGSGLHIRTGAGPNKASLAVLPKGTKVQNYGYYTEFNGVAWLYVQTTHKGTKYTGFCSIQYLSKN